MTQPTRQAWRLIGAAAAGALAVGLVPASDASAQTPALQPIPIAAFCGDAPDASTFIDVAGTTFEEAIACLEVAQIALGVGGGTAFRPELHVTRQQMASLVARAMDTATALDDDADPLVELAGYDGTNAFTDVEVGNTHLASINRLEAAGIVQGGVGGRPGTEFVPGLPMTREQMATTMANAIGHLVGVDLEAQDDYFVDDTGRVHEPSINVVAEFGIGVGDGVDRFGPTALVTRGQMTGFLSRGLALLHIEELIAPLPAPAAPPTADPPAEEVPVG